MAFLKTKDSEVYLRQSTGLYYYRGTPRRGCKNIMRSLATKSLSAAIQKKRTLLEELRGVDFSVKRIMFGAYVQKTFLRARERELREGLISVKTQEKDAYALGYLLGFFERHFVDTINENSWAHYKNWCQENKSNRSLEFDRQTLVLIFNRLHDADLVRKIPRFDLPARKRQERRAFTFGEIQHIFRAIDSMPNKSKHRVPASAKWKVLALTILKTGARPGEIYSLKWDRIEFAIDLSGAWLTVIESKNKRMRRFWVGEELAIALFDWKKTVAPTSDDEIVFASWQRPGKPLERTNKTWKAICVAADIPQPNNIYCLRHSFLSHAAVRARTGQENNTLICKYVGTSVKVFEEHYLHVDGKDTARVAELMPNVLNSAPRQLALVQNLCK